MSDLIESSQKIALFLSYLGGGGAERVMINLARGLVDQGLKVDLVLGKAWGPHLSKVPNEVRVVDLGASRPLMSLPALVRYLKQEQPLALLSAMHYANEIALCARRLAGVSTRVVVSEHNTLSRSIKQMSRMKRHLVPFFIRHLYPWADGIVAVSKGAAKDLLQLTHLSSERIQAIYNPVVTPDLFDKAKMPVDHPWFAAGEPPVILGVGKLEAQKDFPTLIRAFAKVRQVRPSRLMILGWGPNRPQLESLIKELGLEQDAALLGYVDNPYAYMTRAALFVLSSAWEGLPTVLIEAMALGAPVISTDCESGPREILNQGCYGKLTPVGDSDSIAEAILEVLTHKPQPVDPAWLDQFKTAASVQQYLNLLQSNEVLVN